ncbi:MAG: tetratricopeptide repeat protein [Sphingopyxis sp.]
MAPVQPHRISPLSLAMQQEGARLFTNGELDAATDYFETALVADPRNADALIGLGDIARRQQLPGKAIGHFRGALRLRPDNPRALAGQGSAYAARGAMALARQNLAQLQNLCDEEACTEVTELNAAIQAAGARASPHTALRPDQVMPRPMIEALPN